MVDRQKISLEQRVIQFIKQHNLVSPGDTLLVAVSGGTDSVCLLHLLMKQQATLGVKLHVAHLNHKLRGDESDEDAWYVVDLANSLDIPVTIDARDVAAYRDRKHCSLEEAAREVRYSFLAEAAAMVDASCVVVGHTRNDQVETILLHLLRGTGIAGLRGLQPQSRLLVGDRRTPLTVIRPLLEVSRQETEDYCQRFSLAPRGDSSNESTAFLRNRIRLELLPILKEYNPRFDDGLLKLATIAADDIACLEEQASRLWDKVAEVDTSAVYLDRDKMYRLSSAMQRYLFRKAAEQLLGNLRDIEADHVEAMVHFLSKPAGKSLCLPHELRLSVEYGRLVLSLAGTSACPFLPLEKEVKLNVPGDTVLSGWIVKTEVVRGKAEISRCDVDNFTACFDLEKTGSELIVRQRRRGDRFQPLGMRQLKSLQDFMVDAHIPRSWRNMVPLLCSPVQILWVTGWRIDDRAKITRTTRKTLKVQFMRSSCGL